MGRGKMGFNLRSWGGRKEQNDSGKERTPLYLNVYDLTPVNEYLYWFGLGIFHSGVEGRFLHLVYAYDSFD